MTNLNESASANSLNRSNHYVTKLGDNNDNNLYATQNMGLYGDTPIALDVDDHANPQYGRNNVNTIVK